MNARKSNDDRSPFLASLNAVPVCRQRVADTDWCPAVNVSDTGDRYLFEFDLPGLNLEDIQFSRDDAAPYLNGERKTLRYCGKSLRAEHPAGTFVRRLVLTADACGDEFHAILQVGVLQLQVPRKLPPDENG